MKGFLLQSALISFAVGAYVGCSPVKFSLNTEPCESTNTCIVENGKFVFNETKTVGGGKVDVLIVNDNSASMSFEQKNLAARFSGFIQSLDNRKIDYRIAMTTTDVHVPGDNNEPRAINGSGTRQNGGLIPFSNNLYLTPAISNRVSLFNETVVRAETLQCEQFIASWVQTNGLQSTETSAEYARQYKANCPSGDERGVYAASLAVSKNQSNFIRGDSHLAVIFLSDEDVRSSLYDKVSGFQLAAQDQPANLIQTIYGKFGNNKGISVHSISVKDSSCLAQQNDQTLGNPPVSMTRGMVKGSIGAVYQTFAARGWGKNVDICFNDYTSQLGDITAHIIEKVGSVTVQCSAPEELSVEFIPANNSITYTLEGKTLRFSQNLPIGSQVKLSYKCTNLN